LPRPHATPSIASALHAYGASKLDFAIFTRYRELWRWAERFLACDCSRFLHRSGRVWRKHEHKVKINARNSG
jgi:hypothetical protein